MMLIQRICIALSGFGRPSRVERVMSERAAMLLNKALFIVQSVYDA